jgi:hypothetical protein
MPEVENARGNELTLEAVYSSGGAAQVSHVTARVIYMQHRPAARPALPRLRPHLAVFLR